MAFLVVGLGISGIGALDLLNSSGDQLYAYDKDKNRFDELMQAKLIPQNCICMKKLNKKNLQLITEIVVSPGVFLSKKVLKLAEQLHIKIISEVELAYRYCPSEIFAITGTNGKTTTTLLLNALLNTEYSSVAVGNVGNCFSAIVNKLTQQKCAVCEVSSFQLENIDKFAPKFIGFLNFAPDHLDRYKTLEEYWLAKTRIFDNVTEQTVIALNYDDEKVKTCVSDNAKILFFSLTKLPNNIYGAYFNKDKLIYKDATKKLTIDIKNRKLLGEHNIYNILCATVLAINKGVSKENIERVITSFLAPTHRLESVATINGIEYIDDSKATNTDSCIKAVKSISKPIVLLLGGSDKKEDLSVLFTNLPTNVKQIITFGAMRKKLAKSAQKHNFIDTIIADNLLDAFLWAQEFVVSGDVVLFSPACASFDEFRNFEERGDVFKELVYELQKGAI